ncbi:MAG: CPBP family intramembrane metalloprotease [Euryarchaeota archaeon]|nr:CPBP family intramembrane metalloprotease [Euryarchaeota archaeon]
MQPNEENGPPDAKRLVGLRLTTALLGAAVIWYVFARAAELVAEGYTYTPWAVGVVGSLLAAAFGLYAISPRLLEPLCRRAGLEVRRWDHVFAGSVMALLFFVIIGIGIVGETLYNYESIDRLGKTFDDLTLPSATGIVVALMFNFILYMVPVVVWVGLVDGKPGLGTVGALGLATDRLPNRVFLGVATTLLIFGALGVIGLFLFGYGIEAPTNPRALQIASALDLRTAFLVAAFASVGEELFFRGFLQPRIGLWGQAVLFGLAHASYLNVLQVLVTFALAVVYGLIRRRTGDVIAPIVSHFLFDFLMIVLVIYAGQPSPPPPQLAWP